MWMNVRVDNTTASSHVSTPLVDLPASVQQASASIIRPAEVKRTFRSQQKETLHYLKTQVVFGNITLVNFVSLYVIMIIVIEVKSNMMSVRCVLPVVIFNGKMFLSVFTQILMNVCLS